MEPRSDERIDQYTSRAGAGLHGGEAEQDTVGDSERSHEGERLLEDARAVQMQVEESPQSLQGQVPFLRFSRKCFLLKLLSTHLRYMKI